MLAAAEEFGVGRTYSMCPPEDIPLLATHFAGKHARTGEAPRPFAPEAMEKLLNHSWPGNIRELENLVKRYVIVGNEPQIIRELSTHKPIVSSLSGDRAQKPTASSLAAPVPAFANGNSEMEMTSLLEIGKRAAMQAEREASERVLAPLGVFM